MLLLLLDIRIYLRVGSGNQAFVKLGEQLVPVLKVQSTSCINSPCVQRTAVLSLWCFLTFYKVLELTCSLRDSISGQMSPPSILWSEVVRAAEMLLLETGVSELVSSIPVPSLPFMLCRPVCDFCNCSEAFES